MDPKYTPPYDYKPPKKTKKIFVPTTEQDGIFINYIGQIIGPGGST